MRQVLSISLPGDIIKEVKNRIKNRGYKSISEYVKFLFEEDNDDDYISEEELLEDIKQARKEYKAGKTIKANSLSELL